MAAVEALPFLEMVGQAGTNGSSAGGGEYGGGGGAPEDDSPTKPGLPGGDGTVRIIWPGSRSFPSTNVAAADSTTITRYNADGTTTDLS